MYVKPLVWEMAQGRNLLLIRKGNSLKKQKQKGTEYKKMRG
jgi:hypothetical protein